ncbi:MAG: MoaD family protein [Treponema sp.]|nr:MoaD family protein [Treponema sp.]
MRVKFFSYIRNYTGCAQLELPAPATAGDLARHLCRRYPGEFAQKLLRGDGSFGEDIIMLINGRHVVHLGGPEAPLAEKDTVHVFPLVAGG